MGWLLLATAVCTWLGVIGLCRLVWERGGAVFFIPWAFVLVPCAMVAAGAVEVLIAVRARRVMGGTALMQSGVRALMYAALAVVAANVGWYPFWFAPLFGSATR